MQFEYLVCLSQKGMVTWANGEWLGTLPLPEGDSREGFDEYEEVLESCPGEAEYLNRMGQDGWELVAVDSTLVNAEIEVNFWSNDELDISAYRMLYLKRPTP